MSSTSFSPLEESDELKVINISSTMDVPHPLNEDIMDDISDSDEYIDKMEDILIDWNMEKINEDSGKMKSMENTKEDSLKA